MRVSHYVTYDAKTQIIYSNKHPGRLNYPWYRSYMSVYMRQNSYYDVGCTMEFIFTFYLVGWTALPFRFQLTHWGRMMHICVGKLIIGNLLWSFSRVYWKTLFAWISRSLWKIWQQQKRIIWMYVSRMWQFLLHVEVGTDFMAGAPPLSEPMLEYC